MKKKSIFGCSKIAGGGGGKSEGRLVRFYRPFPGNFRNTLYYSIVDSFDIKNHWRDSMVGGELKF